jgi:hypothetical protein
MKSLGILRKSLPAVEMGHYVAYISNSFSVLEGNIAEN